MVAAAAPAEAAWYSSELALLLTRSERRCTHGCSSRLNAMRSALPYLVFGLQLARACDFTLLGPSQKRQRP